jgi:O-antigen/teichoic acid export membrane protein
MSHKRKVLQGSVANLIRVLLSMLVSLVLPPFLVHHMAPAEYSAWVLILQLSAYVNLLDFGLQTAIGKYVAEYEASGDREASHHLVSTSFTILAVAAAIACGALAAMVWSVPRLFHQMPPGLVGDVRIALLAVGLSTAVALPFGIFLSTFTGLQRYVFPTIVATVSRVGTAATLILLLLLHRGLVQLALAMAGFNVATAITQFIGWRRFVKERVGFSFLSFHRTSAVRLAKYGSVLSIWTLAMFFISGLDIVIVGHYHYADTGFYSVASGAANFMLVLVSSVFGPLVPAVSSMQSSSTPARIGNLCVKTTRYCVLLLCLLGLPLFFGAYPLLSLWVTKRYAVQSALYLEVLVLGNVVRQLAFPYILVVVATGKQHLATVGGIVEAGVNVALSIWLVQKIGTVGVALGTLGGAFVGFAMHMLVSIPRTQASIFIRRSRFLLQGILRPLLVVAPIVFLFPCWRRLTMLPADPAVLALWAAATAAIAWWAVLTTEDRREFGRVLRRLLYLRADSPL